MSRKYRSKAATLAHYGKSNNWLLARIENDGFPPPVFLGGRDAMFDIDACDAWEERMRSEERRIFVSPPVKAVQS